MVAEKQIAPHVILWEKDEREDGTFSRSDFVFDAEGNTYKCPPGKLLKQFWGRFQAHKSGITKDGQRLYRARFTG
jgi:hypothetical protein